MAHTIYEHFNSVCYSDKSRANIKAGLEAQFGAVGFRLCESPIFLTPEYADEMLTAAKEIVAQLMTPDYFAKAEDAIPEDFKANGKAAQSAAHWCVDFAVAKGADGQLAPQLVEVQAGSCVFAYAAELAEAYKTEYQLGDEFKYMVGARDKAAYIEQLRANIIGGHDPRSVVLIDVEPEKQMHLMDFKVFEKHLGLKILDVDDILCEGDKVYYMEGDQKIRINRIYNRAIPEEFSEDRPNKNKQFKYSDNVDVEWVCHPSQEMRYSKFALPFLDHPAVPKTYFLSDVTVYPEGLASYVLKPLYSFSGKGVKIDITKEDLDAIPQEQRKNFLLMTKIDYAPLVPDSDGNFSKAEVRCMCFAGANGLEPVVMWARVTKGKLVSVGRNKEGKWVGVAPVFIVNDKQSAEVPT